MAAKDTERKRLHKLSRVELLELLLAQTRETELLHEKLDEANAALTERYLRITEAGDLAHAVLDVNKVMEAAQAAAQQYLDNIATMKKETENTCIRLINEAKQEAERIRSAALAGELPTEDSAEKIVEKLKEKNTQTGEYL